jgi:ATP synthase protein I
MDDDEGQRKREAASSAGRAAAGLRTAAVLSGIGFLMAGSVVVGTVGGMWLDRHLHSEPWLTALGAILGSAAGFVQMFRLVKLAGTGKK